MPLLLSIAIMLCVAASASAQRVLTYSDSRFQYKVFIDSVPSRDSVNHNGHVRSIEIFRQSDRKVVQTILPDENCHWDDLPKDQLLILEDMNFDGHDDIRMFQGITAGPNTPYYYLMYDVASSTFRRDTSLEEVTSPDFDREKKLVYSSWRSSCCSRGMTTYKYIRGRLTKIEEVEDRDDSQRPGWYITTVRKLVNGKMKVVERRVEKESDQ